MYHCFSILKCTVKCPFFFYVLGYFFVTLTSTVQNRTNGLLTSMCRSEYTLFYSKLLEVHKKQRILLHLAFRKSEYRRNLKTKSRRRQSATICKPVSYVNTMYCNNTEWYRLEGRQVPLYSCTLD